MAIPCHVCCGKKNDQNLIKPIVVFTYIAYTCRLYSCVHIRPTENKNVIQFRTEIVFPKTTTPCQISTSVVGADRCAIYYDSTWPVTKMIDIKHIFNEYMMS